MDASMIAGLEVDELREVARRLQRSCEGLEVALGDLEVERTELDKEKGELNSSIALVMQDLQKLNITSSNLNEPRLADETPVEFIGRLWERVKPRDTAYIINEHVGEIVKPSYSPDGSPSLGKQVAQQGQELRKQFSDHFSNFRTAFGQATEGFSPSGQETSQDQGFPAPATSMGQFFSYFRNPGGIVPDVGPDTSGPGADDETPAIKVRASSVDRAAESTVASSGSNSQASSKTPSRESGDAQNAEAKEEIVSLPAVEESAVAEVSEVIEKPASVEAAAEVSAAGEAASTKTEEQPAAAPVSAPEPVVEAPPTEETSSLLIDVKFSIDDGSVAECKVYASDRVKNVATRFVQENSLKSSFEAPVKAYLMEAEANALTFPVTLEADLMEICQKYAAKK